MRHAGVQTTNCTSSPKLTQTQAQTPDSRPNHGPQTNQTLFL